MKHRLHRPFSGQLRGMAVALGMLCLAGVPVSALAFDSGSTGADGAFAPAVSTEVVLPPNGILNYTTVNIPANVTVTFRRNALNTPVVILATGDVKIEGTISVAGENSKPTGTAGGGSRADDGIPGRGGPGGFDGGRGGAQDAAGRKAIVEGAAGQGPGGGQGGRVTTRRYGNCDDNRYYGYMSYGLGAGYRSPGADAYYTTYSCNGGSPAAPAYGSHSLSALIGGSGGGGGLGSSSGFGSGGGGGGGAVLIAASGSIELKGTVSANGGDSGYVASAGSFGAGGSGGAIRLVAGTVSGSGQLLATGGCRLSNDSGSRDCDPQTHAGSAGFVRVEADSMRYTGSANPVASIGIPSGPGQALVPSVRFVSLGGQVVPSVPTGSGDVVLPADVVNPVTAALAASNVPLGSTVSVRVIPVSGLPITSTSTGLAGTLESSQATASFTLPQGPSRIEASVQFAVPVALVEALSRFASNEEVRFLETTVGLDGRSMLALITNSGRRVPIGADLFQLANLLALPG